MSDIKIKALLVLLLITCSLCENISSKSSLYSSYSRYRKNSFKTSYKSLMTSKLKKIEELSKYSFKVLSLSKNLVEAIANIDNALEKLKEIKTLFDESQKEAKVHDDKQTVRKTQYSIKDIESIEDVLIKLKSEFLSLREIQNGKEKREKLSKNIQKKIVNLEKIYENKLSETNFLDISSTHKLGRESIVSEDTTNELSSDPSSSPNFLERKFQKKLQTHKGDDNPLISQTPFQIISKMGKDCSKAIVASANVCSTQFFHFLPQTFCIKKFDLPRSPICPDGTDSLFFSCQDKCPESFKKFFGICIEECPKGYYDWGLWCHRDWFNFKAKEYRINRIRSYLDESVKCPNGSAKFLGLCYNDCGKIGLKNYWGVCASSDSQLTNEGILKLIKYVFSVLKLVAFVGTGGASSTANQSAQTAFDKAIKVFKTSQLFNFDEYTKKLVDIGVERIIKSALINLNIKLIEMTVNQTCKNGAESFCKDIIEKQIEKFATKKERKIEQEKKFTEYLDIIGIEKTFKNCKDGDLSADCITSILEKVDKFDPSGISGILSVFVMPFCKIPEDNVVDLRNSELPENVWFQILANKGNEVEEENKCLSYNGYQKQIVIKKCDADNEEQFFTMIKHKDENSYFLRNKSTLFIKYNFLKKNDQKSIVIDNLPILDTYEPRDYIFHITKHVNETLKKDSEINENPNEIEIIIQPKNSREADEQICLEKSEENTLMMSNCKSKSSNHIFKINIHHDQEKFMDIDLSKTYLIKVINQNQYQNQQEFNCMKSTPFFKDIVFDDCSNNVMARHWNLIKSSYGGYQIVNKISQLPLGYKFNRNYIDNDYELSAVVAVPIPNSETVVAKFIPWKNKEGFYRFELILNDNNYNGRIFLESTGGFVIDSSYKKYSFKFDISKEDPDLISNYMLKNIKAKTSIFSGIKNESLCVVDKGEADKNMSFDICDETNKNQYWKFIPQEAPFYKIESVSRPGYSLQYYKKLIGKNIIVLNKDENNDQMLWIVHAAEGYISIINKFSKECAMRNGTDFDLADCKDYEPEFLFILTEKQVFKQ